CSVQYIGYCCSMRYYLYSCTHCSSSLFFSSLVWVRYYCCADVLHLFVLFRSPFSAVQCGRWGIICRC
uniref:Uncharacterized protein n=1 Tax=Aegilops tauschii subsp. strangulata TaxID=200361 RepID=A0A453PLR8_AEGTS